MVKLNDADDGRLGLDPEDGGFLDVGRSAMKKKKTFNLNRFKCFLEMNCVT